MAKRHVHGYISVLFVFAAMNIGFIALHKHSFSLAICYAILTIFAYCIVAVVYCSKCQCRDTCNHLLIGMLSKFLSRPNLSPYTKTDVIFGVAIPVGITILLPQFWLSKYPALLLSFWVLLLIGTIEIIFFVCKGCENKKCSMCR